MVLVDTDVLVDCLRGTAPAKEWLARASAEVLGIPGVVAMELVIGCRNQGELHRKALVLAIRSGAGRNHVGAGIEAPVPLRSAKTSAHRITWRPVESAAARR